MDQRLTLQLLLESLTAELDEDERLQGVYFQAPPNNEMQYPCIVYRWDDARTEFADNKPYSFTRRYQITVIDENPDSKIPELVSALPMCLFDRFFTSDNLNHSVFNIFF
jgi:hypothetical protein